MNEINAVESRVSEESSNTKLSGSRLTFLREWLRNPLRMSSVTPSGRQLAGMMAAAIPAQSRGVIELGAGTGVITHALIARGIQPQQLLVVEMNNVLHGLLKQAFPRAHVISGDARALQQIIADAGAFADHRVDAVVSSLGLLNMPETMQHDILDAAFAALSPGGVFVQYTYGLSKPLSARVCNKLGLRCRRHGSAWRNLPPARVYVYSRNEAAGD